MPLSKEASIILISVSTFWLSDTRSISEVTKPGRHFARMLFSVILAKFWEFNVFLL